ncbi:MAG TPA: methyltransferase domain-containing protein [Longilinea sp.]|nr:methyltransferase domain-containing protein [Longilinea sp.]
METPPVCNYEGSDYQTSFWEQGGRAYEDACEVIALKRLLPPAGKHLLELGAGAGRNTPRYAGYEKITLVDYSRTQLEQAHQRLGDSERYRFVAADIYRLPFAPATFDGATMIRTLHHMKDARAALVQVFDTLEPGAVFILEFANKKNIKAILRYAFKRQTWNPNSPEPVEFAALNFDFHPGTVRAWLNQAGFAIERQLTVSHFRSGFFKKVFPLKFLTTLDSILQPTGNLWQLSPSVFVRASVHIQPAAHIAGAFFRCPACGHTPLPDTPPVLTCPACKRKYPVKDGIYDLRVDPS